MNFLRLFFCVRDSFAKFYPTAVVLLRRVLMTSHCRSQIPLTLLFFRLSRPSSLRLFSYKRYSSPLIIFALCGLTAVSPCVLSTGEPRIKPSTPVMQHSERVQGKDHLLLFADIALPKADLNGILLAHGHLVVHQDPQVFSLQSCFPTDWATSQC